MRKAILIFLFFLIPQTVYGISTDYRFTGQELDNLMELYYYGQRYYDPLVGKFTQPDPMQNFLVTPELESRSGMTLEEVLSNPQRLNAYSYSLNNPVNVTDPAGEVSHERQERFDKISDYIRNSEDYWLIRDRDGNAKALDAIWNKSLELAEGKVGSALDTFYDSVHIDWRNNATLDSSYEDFVSRLSNLPSALAGQYSGNRSQIDKLQHFVASARLAYRYGTRIASFLGRLKEVKDGLRGLFSREYRYQDLKQTDDGYSTGDISANQAGIQWIKEYRAEKVMPSQTINSYLY